MVLERNGKCSTYSLTFIPNVKELSELPVNDLLADFVVRQLVEGFQIKIRNQSSLQVGGNLANPVTVTYIFPRTISATPAPDSRKNSKRYTLMTWKETAPAERGQIEISGSLKRNSTLCGVAAEMELVPVSTNESWDSIVSTITKYRNDVEADLRASVDESGRLTRNKLSALIFAFQIYELTQIAAKNKADNGGWASDFVRTALSVSAHDIRQRQSFWVNNIGGCQEATKNEGFLFCDLGRKLPGRAAISYCNAKLFGDEHFDNHLRVGFYFAIKRAFIKSLLESKTYVEDRTARLIETYKKIATEHEALISNAIVPGFKKVEQELRRYDPEQQLFRATWLERRAIPRFARFLVPEQVRPVRQDAVLNVLTDLERERVITSQENQVVAQTILGRR
jgi:hypothetical protein